MNIPPNWTFKNQHIANNFDQHVREQLPWYDLATHATAYLARHYIQDNTNVYDLGCSTGNIGQSINQTLKERNATLIPIDNSQEMLTLYNGPGTPQNQRIQDHQYQPYSLAIAFLALQFIPPHERPKLLRTLRQNILPGGALIIVDKFQPATNDSDAELATYRLTLDAKLRAGATPDQIIQKELSLTGTQRPLHQNEINPATPYFRFGHFAGYVLNR
jgi:tRNA (cmo5U34)-methyltransferase